MLEMLDEVEANDKRSIITYVTVPYLRIPPHLRGKPQFMTVCDHINHIESCDMEHTYIFI
jgi:hypothetical protein